ncbi:PfkB family carbohydrate kinase [Yinghuangia sp. ASG 101]|uniref:carbohydrate kinase family protein n=1 Tax=Yinghuangia sp. ASG 101 TaxID=2896848 RepID=UPI001E523A36|nr:PfkB family carbohydrate kinase [Yinghuangia sp. ASG 101]UGQ10193.1 PfkB family carbohydrate kinase [Yinghuangia sp. ASG 101]
MPERRLPAAHGGRGLTNDGDAAADAPRHGDIAGIGALNVDVIVRTPDRVSGADADSESSATSAEMRELLRAVASMPRRVTLGGSAFTTITAIARLHPELGLGFVGVAGEPPFGAESFVESLTRLGVDAGAVHGTEARAGVCLAIEHVGNRALRVDPGANTAMADHVDGRRAEIVARLSRFRAVHVTSFLDDATPPALLRLIRALRREAPGTRISLDPGDTWCARPTDAVRGLLAAADVVLLNRREFAAVRAHLAPATTDVVVKAPDGVRVRRAGARAWLRVTHEPLPVGEIRRPTGAGDAFAAGFLAASPTGSGDVREAARAGSAAAREHLRGHGASASAAADGL